MSTRSVSRFVGALASVVAVVMGLPLLLLVGANQRFGHLSPLNGMNAPWRWSIADLRSWGRRLTKGLGSSAELVDLFFRVALVVGWICAAVLIYTVVAETMFQLRHGMPSAHHRRLGGLGLLGRRLATALVAVLPLAVSASPALAGSPASRPAVTVVADVAGTQVAMPVPSSAAAVAAASVAPVADVGWSQVEVQRGDSVWAIAERIAHGRDVDVIATQIVEANLGLVMNDGHRFATPALIEPGWLLNVPVSNPGTGTSQPVALTVDVVDASLGDPLPEDSYVVQPGDSYWTIADGRLDTSASEGEVKTYSQELIDINGPVLGYADSTMLHPGDVVRFAPAASGTPPADVAVESQAPVESPPPLLPGVVELSPPVQEPATGAPSLDPPTSLPGPDLPVPIDVLAAPVVAAADPDMAIAEQAPDEGLPVKEGLAAAALLSAGAIAVLQARRRQQLRSAQVGARLLQPTQEAVETETLLRSLSVVDRLARVDLALRCAAPELAAQLARVISVEVSEAGEVRLYPDRLATVISAHWIADAEGGAWRLPADVSLSDLADDARRAHQPCPALIHIGESAGGQLFVDLEAVGVLGVQASPETAAAIVRCAAASLAVSPFAESSRIFTFGLEDETQLGSLNVEAHASLGDAIEAVRTTVGSIIPATSGSVTTFALRAAAHGGEAWEPSLLLALGGNADADDVTGLVALAGGGGRGVGAMIDRPVGNGGMTLRADGNEFILEPLGRRVTPVGLSAADVAGVDNLLDAADRPLVSDVEQPDEPVEAAPVSVSDFADPAHELVVSVLGQVGVQSTGGEPVGFERSKAQELVVWLSQHRHRPTRASARTAMWDLAVRDATFSNVVSDARRAMAKVVTPPAGQEWIGRTMNEDLPLHELVVSDAELLAHRVATARGLDADAAIAVLRPGVERINGMPFAGTAYLWPDAEGTTSSLVLLATSAAAELAAHYLAVDDVDGVFWATGQGLKVLAGHEELIALRMRAHAHRGDLAGVRSEWESYERALNADTWAAAEPSPKLVELRKELLSPSLAS